MHYEKVNPYFEYDSMEKRKKKSSVFAYTSEMECTVRWYAFRLELSWSSCWLLAADARYALKRACEFFQPFFVPKILKRVLEKGKTKWRSTVC